MPKPVRLQRSRAKGAKLLSPNGLPNTYVGRGSKWGNPYRVGQRAEVVWIYDDETLRDFDFSEREVEVDGHVLHCHPVPPNRIVYFPAPLKIYDVLARYRAHILQTMTAADIRVALSGQNLVCWCPLTSKCHADWLLEVANR